MAALDPDSPYNQAKDALKLPVPVTHMAVLDEASSSALRRYALHPNIYCHHVTLSFMPLGSDAQLWDVMVGRVYRGVVLNIVWDVKGQAAEVWSDIPSQNRFPHVTISCRQDVPPVYSNQLLERNHPSKGILYPDRLEISGVITKENLTPHGPA